MIPVYQTIFDNKIGDCMRAILCTLLDKSISDIPNFLEYGDNWYEEMGNYLDKEGYTNGINLFNKNYLRLCNPKEHCFTQEKYYNPRILTKSNLKKVFNFNGYYFASVLSPGYFNYKDGIDGHTHAVIIDSNCNIVHDPNPAYKNIIEYPLAKLLKYNGVINVWCINKKYDSRYTCK